MSIIKGAIVGRIAVFLIESFGGFLIESIVGLDAIRLESASRLGERVI